MKKETMDARRISGLCTTCMSKQRPSEGNHACEVCLEKRRKWSLQRSPKQRKRKAAWMDRWRKTHRTKHLAMQKACRNRAKEKVYKAYGGKCACCGESNYCFLTIDHVNGDGAVCRGKASTGRRLGDSYKLYVWLIRNSFPKNFQILCYNCNCAKGTKKHCPHFYMKRKKR